MGTIDFNGTVHIKWYQTSKEKIANASLTVNGTIENTCTHLGAQLLTVHQVYQIYPPLRPVFCEFQAAIWFVMSLINLLQTQEERMDELNLFIEHYSKYIVSIIWQRYVLTLHLSHSNCWKAFYFSGSNWIVAAACSYIIVIPDFHET